MGSACGGGWPPKYLPWLHGMATAESGAAVDQRAGGQPMGGRLPTAPALPASPVGAAHASAARGHRHPHPS